jgi:hypothetical protein
LAEQITECWTIDQGLLGTDNTVVELRAQLDSQGNIRNITRATGAFPPIRAPARFTRLRVALSCLPPATRSELLRTSC